MKPLLRSAAFTLLELLLVVAVLFVLVLLLPISSHGPSRPAMPVRCLNNLKQTAMAMHMFAEDHEKRFTPEWAAASRTSAEGVQPDAPAVYLSPLRAYVGHWHAFVCPTDRAKLASTNDSEFDNRKVSYFLSLTTTPQSSGNVILAGDRHLSFNGKAVNPGMFLLASNAPISWTRELHPVGAVARGSLGFVDGHAEFVGTNLPSVVGRQGLTTNQISVP